VVWVVFICILFVLPPDSPITVDNFNYAPIAVLVVAAFAIATWYAGGRTHFMLKTIQPEDEVEKEPEVAS
jgi:hypothetical protein